jgi:hypothetical protein
MKRAPLHSAIFAVQKGGVIREAWLAWQRFGALNDKRDNLILYPSRYSARLADMSGAIGTFKNPHSHRIVRNKDPEPVIEELMLASRLLRFGRP